MASLPLLSVGDTDKSLTMGEGCVVWGHLEDSSEEVSIHILKDSVTQKEKRKRSQLRVYRNWGSSPFA